MAKILFIENMSPKLKILPLFCTLFLPWMESGCTDGLEYINSDKFCNNTKSFTQAPSLDGEGWDGVRLGGLISLIKTTFKKIKNNLLSNTFIYFSIERLILFQHELIYYHNKRVVVLFTPSQPSPSREGVRVIL